MDYSNASFNADTLLFQEEEIVYAGFWERFGAAFIDGLILLIPNYLMQYVLGEIPGQLVGVIISWLYFSIQESGESQATPGKKALGLKVSGLNGQRISFGQATARFFSKYLSMIILLIGYLMMLWDDKNQTLHDKIAGTIVQKV